MRKACKMIATPTCTGGVVADVPREALVRGKDGSKKEAIRAIKAAKKIMKFGNANHYIRAYWPAEEIMHEEGVMSLYPQSISMTVGVYTIEGQYHERIGYWVFKV